MKKLLLALTATVSCAFFAKAANFNQTGFESEGLVVGNVLDANKDDDGGTGDCYWAYGANSGITECVISNYASGAAYEYGNAALVENGPGNKYLWVDASADKLIRTIKPAGSEAMAQAIGDGLYFDSLVQFTATDQPPAIDATQDKLIVWLYASDETNDTAFASEVEPCTNLVVTAGFFNGDTIVAHNYRIPGVAVEPNSWHRLTIKAISTIVTDTYSSLAGFIVYLDGTPVAYGQDDSIGTPTDLEFTSNVTAYNTARNLFPSLLQPGNGAASVMTGVAFDGTGAIDDLTFTDVDPFAVATFDYVVTLDDPIGVTATYAIDAAVAQELISPATLAVPVNATTVNFVVTIPDGYKLVGGHKDANSYNATDETYDWTLAVTVASLAKDDTDELTLSVIVDDGAATTYVLTLMPGTGTTLSATVGGSPVNNGAYIEDNEQVTINAAISDDTAYEDLVVMVGGVDVTSQLVNGSYTFTMAAATTVATSASEKAPSSYSMTLTGGSNASITYAVDGGESAVYTGAVDIPTGSAVVITATPAPGCTYTGVDITGTGWSYDSTTGVLTYTINSMSELADLVVPDATELVSDNWTVAITLGAHVTSVSYVFVDTPTVTNTLSASGSFDIEKTKSFAFVDAVAESGWEIDLEASVATLDGATINEYGVVSPTNDTSVTIIAKSTTPPGENWPTGDALNALDGKSVSATYGIGGDLASVDAKVFTTWASGVGGVAYADKGTTTYSAECFLLNIANNSSAEAIAAAKATAASAIKITAISFDGNGDPVITAPESYGNGKVEIEGTESLAPISWHEKADGDYFFRAKLVIEEVDDAS